MSDDVVKITCDKHGAIVTMVKREGTAQWDPMPMQQQWDKDRGHLVPAWGGNSDNGKRVREGQVNIGCGKCRASQWVSLDVLSEALNQVHAPQVAPDELHV